MVKADVVGWSKVTGRAELRSLKRGEETGCQTREALRSISAHGQETPLEEKVRLQPSDRTLTAPHSLTLNLITSFEYLLKR